MAAPNLGKMVGPLPLGAWVAVIGGGLGFALYTRRQTDVPVSDSGAGSPLDTVGDGSTGGAWTVTAPTPTGGGTDVQTITDNQSWAFTVENWLIAHNYNPGDVVSAISNGLYGAPLPPNQWAIWVAALAHQGAPPESFETPTQATPTPAPVPIPKPPPKPKPVPKPKPTAHTYYKVVRGDNLTKIGQKFHMSWQTIYNNNRVGHRRPDGKMGMIVHPNLILPGWVLLIK